MANAPNDRRDRWGSRCERGIAADVEVAHQPAHGAERLREIRQELHEENQSGEERVQRDAREQQHVGRETSMTRMRQPVHNCHGTERPGKAGHGHRRKTGDPGRPVQGNRQHRAERRSRRNAEGKRRRERIPEQRLQDDARGRERRPDQCGGQHARQARHEEYLRVGIVCERNGPVEHAPETDRCRTHERSDEARQHSGCAEQEPGHRDSPANRHGCGDSVSRATGTIVRCPVRVLVVTSTSTP